MLSVVWAIQQHTSISATKVKRKQVFVLPLVAIDPDSPALILIGKARVLDLLTTLHSSFRLGHMVGARLVVLYVHSYFLPIALPCS